MRPLGPPWCNPPLVFVSTSENIKTLRPSFEPLFWHLLLNWNLTSIILFPQHITFLWASPLPETKSFHWIDLLTCLSKKNLVKKLSWCLPGERIALLLMANTFYHFLCAFPYLILFRFAENSPIKKRFCCLSMRFCSRDNEAAGDALSKWR